MEGFTFCSVFLVQIQIDVNEPEKKRASGAPINQFIDLDLNMHYADYYYTSITRDIDEMSPIYMVHIPNTT